MKKPNKESARKETRIEEKPKRIKPTLYYLEKDRDGITLIRTTATGA